MLAASGRSIQRRLAPLERSFSQRFPFLLVSIQRTPALLETQETILPCPNRATSRFAAPFQNAHDGGLVFAASAGNLPPACRLVHVPRLAADVRFIGFDLAGQFVDGPHAESVPDAMVHEPSSFLGDADSAVNLPRGYAVFAVHHLPHGHQPLCRRKGGILENGPGLRGELPVVVAGAALPAVVLLKEGDVSGAATRAFNPIGPASRYQIFAAVGRGGKIGDRFFPCVEYRSEE